MAARGLGNNYGLNTAHHTARIVDSNTFKGEGPTSAAHPHMSEDDANTLNNLTNTGIDAQTLNNVPNMIPIVGSGNRKGSLNQKDVG